jgi:hypothetical protein
MPMMPRTAIVTSQGTGFTLVPPFVGDHSETWEEFGVIELFDGTPILGGIATISGTNMETAKHFVMCSVMGRPSDGMILMDSDRPAGPTTISFFQPVSAFGAYWGDGVGCAPFFADAAIVLTFQDVHGNVIGSDSFIYTGDGTLMWRGYTFATPVKTITRTASDRLEGFAFDGLQATVASPGPNPAPLSNISTRGEVGTGDQVLIGGFVIGGSAAKQVLIRAIGPSLANLGVAGSLQDPMLSLHDTHSEIATNDDWQSAANAGQVPPNLQPMDSRESAILITLQPGQYTAIVTGKGGTTGVGLVEVYDLQPTSSSTLANISTRGFVGTADGVLIGGFVAADAGSGIAQLLIRAIGPSLTSLGVSGALNDPALALFDANGDKFATNDNWKDTQQAAIQATGKAPLDDRESAILATLPFGTFTAIVTGANGATGVGLIEVFKID